MRAVWLGFGVAVANFALGIACSSSGDATPPAAADGGGANPPGSSGGPPGTTDPADGGDGIADPDGGDAAPPPVHVDCAPGTCAIGAACNVDGDCASKTCSATQKCVVAPSCRGASGPAGVDTCGTGEPGAAGAVVESCCASLPMPVTKTRRLDRYEITAGRLRAFVTAIAQAGIPNVRAWATDYATKNPTSELGKLATDYPKLLDILPDTNAVDAPLPLAMHLGASPIDPINSLDGCYVGTNAYGHATYWQTPDQLKAFGVGYGNPVDGVRKFPREVLDAKAVNCVMPLMLAAFCAWDGGELARMSDYYEVWGRKKFPIGATQVSLPWAAVVPIGKFNWRNGHGGACPAALKSWPPLGACGADDGAIFYQFPVTTPPTTPATDDAPAIGAPGRFPMDVTDLKSDDQEGWYDVAGNMMEAAWPTTAVVAPGIANVCDVSKGLGAGATGCTRTPTPGDTRQGTIRFTGKLPAIGLIGYSFEGHYRRGEDYLDAATAKETNFVAADLKPVSFQYGKVGGRCARPAP